jgi:DNA polymerase
MKDKRERLKSFFLKIRDCRECALHRSRNRFVFGSGSAYAEIMFVGEAPGKNEDLQGLPFVGRAGNILDELLESIGMTRKDIFIANVLKCRPPGNRDPQSEEINTCKEYLFEQIEIIDPKIICTMGKYSTQLILDTKDGITGLRGKVFEKDGRMILPINHPAAVLYNPSRMEILKNDFARIERLLNSDHKVEPPMAGPQKQIDKEANDSGKDEKDSKQLGLF